MLQLRADRDLLWSRFAQRSGVERHPGHADVERTLATLREQYEEDLSPWLHRVPGRALQLDASADRESLFGAALAFVTSSPTGAAT